MATDSERQQAVLDAIRSRRAVRAFTPDPVSDTDLRHIVEAGRWASSASNRRIHTFLVVRDPKAIRLVRTFTPGIAGHPTALIVICTDTERACAMQVQLARDRTTWIDVGTAAMNMLLAAHVLGLGACPVTSFSQEGVATALDLPPTAIPELIVQLGYPGGEQASRRPPSHLPLGDLAFLEHYGDSVPW